MDGDGGDLTRDLLATSDMGGDVLLLCGFKVGKAAVSWE